MSYARGDMGRDIFSFDYRILAHISIYFIFRAAYMSDTFMAFYRHYAMYFHFYLRQ